MTVLSTFRAATVAAGIILGTTGSALAASIVPAFDMFGTLAGATFGGSGIPNDAVAITTFEDSANTITIGLTAHQRFMNDPVLNDGAGTFTAKTGANFGDPTGMTMPSANLGATWNFAYYIDIQGGGTLDDYSVHLLYDFDPATGTDDADLGDINLNFLSSGALLQDSQNLLFGFLALDLPFVMPPSHTPFDPFATGEYSFSLRVSSLGGDLLGKSAINVNVVPEPGTLAILGIGLTGLGALRRRRR